VSRPLPICPVCLRPGWAAQKPAQWTINHGRVPNFRSQVGLLVDDGDGQLRVYRCAPGLGLWHLTNLTPERLQMLIAPRFLDLPAAPRPIPPRTPVEPWQDYQYRVAAAVMLAIHAQERGLAFPPVAVFTARYKVQPSWARDLAGDFARNGLMRKIGALYVTGAPRADEVPTS
jgi:hypothetical protein